MFSLQFGVTEGRKERLMREEKKYKGVAKNRVFNKTYTFKQLKKVYKVCSIESTYH